jgi:hypothetical protein
MREGLSDGRHRKRVAQDIAVDQKTSLDRRDLLGRPCSGDDGRTELYAAALQGAFGHLDDAGRVRHHEFDTTGGGHAPVPKFGVQGAPVVCTRRALAVGEERLADVREGDGFFVVEWVDRRVRTPSPPRPGSEKEGEGNDVRMQSGRRLVVLRHSYCDRNALARSICKSRDCAVNHSLARPT